MDAAARGTHHPVSPQLRGFPGSRTSSANTRKVPRPTGSSGSPQPADIWHVPGLGAGPSSSHPSPQSVLATREADIVPTSQTRKLRLGEVKQLAQDNTTSQWQSEDLNPRSLLVSCELIRMVSRGRPLWKWKSAASLRAGPGPGSRHPP